MSLWVLGTDTGVGKTLVSALLLSRYAASLAASGVASAYFKPVATGGREDRDRNSVAHWLGDQVVILDEVYLFDAPVSPHLAARLAGVEIDTAHLVDRIGEELARDPARSLVIEGAGGVMVPLTESGQLLIDVVAATALPVLVVARSTLGTINHTLLTLAALRGRGIAVAGVALVGPINEENSRAVNRFGGVSVVAEVPPADHRWPPAAAPSRQQVATLAATFDVSAELAALMAG